MYIHLGGDQIVRARDVIAILDHQSMDSLSFLESSKQAGRLVDIPDDEVKSYVVTSHRVYSSPISSVTLMRRAKQIRVFHKNK
ncbi:extracellular matrix regulator RemB [Thermoactinomyces sp. DSM 45892]|uniref:extracellular matrix regulator RemB n=1 Tax=Thermoactinomyces sp. DSM 45892 TaxID=1882753 RepID=UPI0008993824|nr:extracellular matrix/biofilm biosynthesis regulator RemA family protein [Thermoactinomyces sp. DSM 45892]SDY36250.1 protein of unknown function [Thermoactinomyces sp. DSM 45892]